MSGEAMRERVMTEADTCREFVTPRLVESGWSVAPHAIGEQRTFTNGRIIVTGTPEDVGRAKVDVGPDVTAQRADLVNLILSVDQLIGQ